MYVIFDTQNIYVGSRLYSVSCFEVGTETNKSSP
jgi:hypothetical protein